ncbi:isoaspartyl dipeptidase IadA [Clostridium cf. saccharolyticum K10] [Clostridioides difficile]|nr:isoaspartyl dipeptidase IadA [Clostridium cf. saccharolyticum K10] [Clostridioides difficile]
MAVYDAQGNYIGLIVTTVETMHKEFKDLVLKEKIPLETALRVITSNVSRAIGMYPQKGTIKEGADADLVLMDCDLEIREVYARGKLAANENGALLHNVFEHSTMM